MQIVRRPPEQTTLVDVSLGEIFLYDETVYMRTTVHTSAAAKAQGSRVAKLMCVNLETGMAVLVPANTEITLCPQAKLLI